MEAFLDRALITGIGGFAGGYLVEYLTEHPAEVGALELHGVWRQPPPGGTPSGPAGRLARVHQCDLTNPAAVRALIGEIRPDLIFHLAAQASVTVSWADPAGTFVNNVVGQVNLLEAVAELAPSTRVLVVGSAEEYGLVRPDELPITEDQPFRPNNPYSVSKISQDMLGYQYFVGRRLAIIRVRPFNHLGPRQRDQFVGSGFAHQIAAAEVGQVPPVVSVGNLSARRDFSDVRDVVRAYWLALTRGKPGEVYNIATGRSVAVQVLLDRLLALSGFPLRVESDPSKLRPSDIPELRGDASRLRMATGWEPRISLDETLRDILAHWRAVVAERVDD